MTFVDRMRFLVVFLALIAGAAWNQVAHAATPGIYVAKGTGSFYDYPVTVKAQPSDTDFVCVSSNPIGPWTSALGRPGNFQLWSTIPATASVCTCDISSGACKNQNGGIETYVLRSAISGTTTTPSPPVTVPPTSGDGTATINWTAPTKDTSGAAIIPTGYNLYWGTNPASLAKVSLPPTPLTYTLNGLASGTYYFAMTALAGGLESDRTNLASKVVTANPNPAPGPVIPPVQPPPSPSVSASGGSWSAKRASTNLKKGLATHDDCLSFLATQAAGKYSCAFAGEVVTVK